LLLESAGKISLSAFFANKVLISRQQIGRPLIGPALLSIRLQMRRNVANLLVSLCALNLVLGCFWSSNRESGTSAAEPDVSESNTSSEPVANSENRSASTKKADKGDFLVEHLEIKTPRYLEIDKQVQSEKLLPKAADRLNRALILPYDIQLRTKDCSQSNAFYDSRDHSVTMCYELMEDFFQTFRSAGQSEQVAYAKMFDAVKFVFLHEIGHALMDAYKLPVMGNDEDAADRCAAFINITELGEEGVRNVMAAAEAFSIESKKRGAKRNMADDHLLQEQRFYNSLCMIYGSDQQKYANILNDGFLPKERAVRCPAEYQRTVDAWVSLLGPWRKA
jgi:hypothetical protein